MRELLARTLETILVHGSFLLEEGLGYGLVVPFPAYGFAALVSNNENLNSPNSSVLLFLT